MKKILAAVCLLGCSMGANALNIIWNPPVFLYTDTKEYWFNGAPGEYCKVIVSIDYYLGAQPVMRTGMVCVGGV